MKKYVAYYRVSTKEQGKSGLGLESQKSMVSSFINDTDKIIAEFTEIESGKNNYRHELMKAITRANNENATLIIAKLDRLSRNISFIFSLKESGVDFVCVDLPEMNTLTLGIFATLAQHEREIISERTKKALAEKKKQGFKLGTDNLTQKGRQKSIEIRREKSLTANQKAIAYIESLREHHLPYREIAKRLNNNGYRTAKNGLFYANTVRRLFEIKKVVSSNVNHFR